MAGCSVGTPPSNEAANIEATTARSACVGSLSRWHRVFAFQKRGDDINRDIISVTYIEAGHRNLPAGRFLSEPGWHTIVDDSEHRVAGGEYSRERQRFNEWTCGCNFSPRNVDYQIECHGNGS
jgi:hypothetical protein